MNVALRVPMTLEQFLDWEERQKERYEFDGEGPVAMNGGTAAHSTIQANLIAALAPRLRGTPCRVHGSHLKVKVAGHIRYPDAFIVCTRLEPKALVAAEPVIVFEILSETTSGTDLIVKGGEYRATPSIKRYVVLSQDSPAAMVFRHRAGDWVVEHCIGADACLPLPEVGADLPLSELYDGVMQAADEP